MTVEFKQPTGNGVMTQVVLCCARLRTMDDEVSYVDKRGLESLRWACMWCLWS